MRQLEGYRDRYYHGRSDEEHAYLRILKVYDRLSHEEKAGRPGDLVRFLNQWKCRFSNEKSPSALAHWILDHTKALSTLEPLTVLSTDIASYHSDIDQLYESLINLKRAPAVSTT